MRELAVGTGNSSPTQTPALLFRLGLKTAAVGCAVCALNLAFPFNDFEWCTGDGLGTFVLGWGLVFIVNVCAYS